MAIIRVQRIAFMFLLTLFFCTGGFAHEFSNIMPEGRNKWTRVGLFCALNLSMVDAASVEYRHPMHGVVNISNNDLSGVGFEIGLATSTLISRGWLSNGIAINSGLNLNVKRLHTSYEAITFVGTFPERERIRTPEFTVTKVALFIPALLWIDITDIASLLGIIWEAFEGLSVVQCGLQLEITFLSDYSSGNVRISEEIVNIGAMFGFGYRVSPNVTLDLNFYLRMVGKDGLMLQGCIGITYFFMHVRR